MILLAFALLQAATAAPVCATYDSGLPAALSAWTKAEAPFETFGATTLVATDPTSVVPPQKPGKVTSLGFTIVKRGTYRIALDQPGWIDVSHASDPAPLKPVSFGHGPECSTIRKLVVYELPAGEYILRLSGLTKASAKVMLVEGAP